MNIIKNEQESIKTDTKESQGTRSEYFKNLYCIKLENLKEMNEFLGSARPSKLNQVEVNNLNRPITNQEIEILIKGLPTEQNPGPDGFTEKFFQTFK